MKIQWIVDEDVASIYLLEGATDWGHRATPGIFEAVILHFNSEGRLAEIEFLDARSVLPERLHPRGDPASPAEWELEPVITFDEATDTASIWFSEAPANNELDQEWRVSSDPALPGDLTEVVFGHFSAELVAVRIQPAHSALPEDLLRRGKEAGG